MRVYKVVGFRGNNLFSVNTIQGGRVWYQLNEKAVPLPDCGPLCAFKTKKQALGFIKGCHGLFAAYEAEATISENQEEIWIGDAKEDGILIVHELKKDDFPPGTILCDSITLKKRIGKMKVYKVVRKTDQGLVSMAGPGVTQVKYRLNRKAAPPYDCGPLCAFEDLEQAREMAEFVKDEGEKSEVLIYEAEAKISPEQYGAWSRIEKD